MLLIPSQRLRAPAQRDWVARLRERLAFARYRYNLVFGDGLIIHFTTTLPLLLVLPSPSPSVLPSFLGHLVVLLLWHFCDNLCVNFCEERDWIIWWMMRWAGFHNLRATVGGRPDAGLSPVNVCPISDRALSGVWIFWPGARSLCVMPGRTSARHQ